MTKTLGMLSLSLLLIHLGGCTHVDAGHVGVVVEQCSGGGVQPAPVSVGYHATGPCTDIIEFPTFQQTAAFKDAESLSVNDQMGLPIKVDVVLNFTIDGAKTPGMYTKFRLDLDNIKNGYMRQVTYEAVKEVFSSLTAQQLYSDKQEPARASIQALLADKLKADGFIVTQFTINKTVVPDNVVHAIQQKVAMIEDAQRVEQELRKTEAEMKKSIAVAEGEAKATIAKAKGEAEARQITADSEAYTNRAVSQSITPVLVDYLRSKRWDGKLPQVQSSGTPLINLK